MLNDERWIVIDRLHRFCDARGRSMLEVAVNWLLAQPGVASVIAGATKPEQVERNVKAAGWKLSASDLAELDTITLPDSKA
ncbi:General stress protein 69 [compost metagenome]